MGATMDQMKMLNQLRKAQKSLKNEIVEVEAGDGAVTVQITGELKIKSVKIDPAKVDLDDIQELEHWTALMATNMKFLLLWKSPVVKLSPPATNAQTFLLASILSKPSSKAKFVALRPKPLPARPRKASKGSLLSVANVL